MIDSGKDFGLGPITKKGEGAWKLTKKRYNVAASRAQDQMWVVHSLDPLYDLKPGDLREESSMNLTSRLHNKDLHRQRQEQRGKDYAHRCATTTCWRQS